MGGEEHFSFKVLKLPTQTFRKLSVFSPNALTGFSSIWFFSVQLSLNICNLITFSLQFLLHKLTSQMI